MSFNTPHNSSGEDYNNPPAPEELNTQPEVEDTPDADGSDSLNTSSQIDVSMTDADADDQDEDNNMEEDDRDSEMDGSDNNDEEQLGDHQQEDEDGASIGTSPHDDQDPNENDDVGDAESIDPHRTDYNEKTANTQAEILRLAASIGQDVTFTPLPPADEETSIPPADPSIPLTTLTNPDACLDSLSLDCLRHVFSFLLRNPELGTPQSLGNDYGQNERYGLHPEILRVNKRISAEGHVYLYGVNTFFSLCQQPLHIPASPLTRYLEKERLIYGRLPTLSGFVPCTLATQLLTVVSCLMDDDDNGVHVGRSFKEFCQSVSKNNSMVKFEVALIPKSMELSYSLATDYANPRDVLQPMRLLRNIPTQAGTAILRPADHFDCNNGVSLDIDSLYYADQLEDFPELQVEIIELVNGDSPVEYGHEMYAATLRYCQALERLDLFKHEMSLDKRSECLVVESFEVDEDWYFESPDGESRNPFKGKHTHPVEAALMAGRRAVDRVDVELFKTQRAIALEYSEPEYQRVKVAAKKCYDYVVSLKKYGHIFDPYHGPYNAFGEHPDTNYPTEIQEAMTLLGDLYEVYKRDMPAEIIEYMKDREAVYKFLYKYSRSDFEYAKEAVGI